MNTRSILRNREGLPRSAINNAGDSTEPAAEDVRANPKLDALMDQASKAYDRQDFDDMPVLASRGGWGRANRDFDGKLADLINELNREVAAA